MDAKYIHLPSTPRAFTLVDNLFIDRYLPLAPGEFVKVYLLLLRLAKDEPRRLSFAEAADTLRCTEGDVRRAVRYWQEQGLLDLTIEEGDATTPRETPPKQNGTASVSSHERTMAIRQASDIQSASAPGHTAADTLSDENGRTDTEALSHQTADDALERLDHESVRELLFVGEQYFGRPLSATEAERLSSFYTQMHMSVDLITYLMEYCIENNHKSIHYMEKVAASWKADKITTVSQAMEQIELFSKNMHVILREFGISGRTLAQSEADFVKKWQREYGFSNELIRLACKKTILFIHQPSFEYADKILASWLAAKVQTPKDVEALEEKRKKERDEKKSSDKERRASDGSSRRNMNNFDERSYDMTDLESQLLGAGGVKDRG